MENFKPLVFIPFILVILVACQSMESSTPMQEIGDNETENIETTDENISMAKESARITGVTWSGSAGNYTFSVTIESPDTGCDQYADWWEVITADGTLVYRRILGHSHVDEQPFTRSGGTADIEESTEIIVRAHMNNLGYGTEVMRGTISEGLVKASIDREFALELTATDPLPTNCAF